MRGQAHTNGIESFWAVLKRAHKGFFHKLSPEHLHHYIAELAAKHNLRGEDTITFMRSVASCMIGKRLMYQDLISDNGLDSMVRSYGLRRFNISSRSSIPKTCRTVSTVMPLLKAQPLSLMSSLSLGSSSDLAYSMQIS